MARRRDLSSSEWFHVSNRGTDRQDIFGIDADRRRWEAGLAETVDEFGLEVNAFAWMSNHIHMILRAPDGRLPQAMRALQGPYARYFNLRTERTGPLFERRYWSRPIGGSADFVVACEYVHRNPVDIVGADRLATYPWSSLAVWSGVRVAPEWLSIDRLASRTTLDRHLDRIRGSIDGGDSRPWWSHRRGPTVDIETLVRVVDDVCGRDVDVRLGGRGRSDHSRQLAMMLAVELRIGDVVDVAREFGVSPSSLRRMARRARVRTIEDSPFAELLADARRRLSAS